MSCNKLETKVSTILGHTHKVEKAFTIPREAVMGATNASRAFELKTELGHSHFFTLSADQLKTLQNGKVLKVTSTRASIPESTEKTEHDHEIDVICADIKPWIHRYWWVILLVVILAVVLFLGYKKRSTLKKKGEKLSDAVRGRFTNVQGRV